MLSEWFTAVLPIDASSNARTGIERATGNGHDLGHLQGEDEEEEVDDEDGRE